MRGGPAEAGVAGADADSSGTKFDRTRMGGFLGGPSVRSIAVAGRAGGGPGEGKLGAPVAFGNEVAGDAVWALGGGGGEGLAASGGAYRR